ncbi:MAG: dephospho-CoA kinase [Candidatus Delongbacteria bacterium]|nr:dephospho-CoA kinase [Candidatus Delongbacteria bacterium]MBN2834177.1 dephospho-CoA kinase [Candidatus Delongbacteria bacterium]
MRIGICGKSGSGKSTVTKFFEIKGFHVIDLDLESKKLYSNVRIKDKIIATFGNESYQNDILDKNYISNLVFNDKSKLEALNSIFFPELENLVESSFSNFDNVIVDGAIIFDSKIHKMTDFNIYIKASENLMLERLLKREKTPSEILKSRIKSQSKYDLYENYCLYSIINDGTTMDLERKINDILNNH